MKRLFTFFTFLVVLFAVSNLAAQTAYWTESFEDANVFTIGSPGPTTPTNITLTTGTWTIYFASRGTNTSYCIGTGDLRLVKPTSVTGGGGSGFSYAITPALTSGVSKITISEGRAQPVTIEKSTDNGTTWTIVGTITCSPAKTPTSLDINDAATNKIRISNQTTGSGKDLDVDDVIVTSYVSGASAVEDYSSMPTQFSLNQNYPNPFNPSTKISFTLGKAGYTTLSIYNVLGQKVAMPISKDLAAGNHEISFNASRLNSGIYFYKLESGNYTAMKKMMLVK